MLHFEWDEVKDRKNLKKHGISFADARTAFDDPNILSAFDENHAQNEDRWISLGRINSGLICVVIHTIRFPNGEERIRIISARPATKHEEKQYYEQ